jgi:threonylcarbamoyladenosine tRNA methylthiotransferase MtaB
MIVKDFVESTEQKTVAFHTMGCRLNFSESGTLMEGFSKRGYKVVDFGSQADVVFLNTCTVTDSADSGARNWIRRAVQSSPEGKIVVAGCFAQMESEQVKGLQGVDLILGTSEKYKVFDYLDTDEDVIVKIDHDKSFWGAATSLEAGQTRAFLKIQDGCNYICSFCIIPFARGRSRTLSINEVVEQAKVLVFNGFKEIVLTGVNIGEYEAKSGEKLTDLVDRLQNIAGLKRLRLSSVEPNTITEELLKVLSSSGIYQEHFHLPLQSGSDRILELMRRKYLSKDYLRVLDLIYKYYPKASVGGDVIVGFPSESDQDFLQTYDLIEKSTMTHLHVFPYSKRKGTTASKMSDHIPFAIKKERVKALIKLGEQKMHRLATSMIGQKVSVLWESVSRDGQLTGHTPNFLKIKAKHPDSYQGTIQPNTISDVLVHSAKNGELETIF